MLVVNLFGAPGAGKSTGAAYVFSKLKMAGVNAELVTEFAKDKVWEESKAVFQNQAYIFGKQYFRISRLNNKVDVVVTDSPIILSAYYCDDDVLGEEFDILATQVFNSYPSINAYIHRVKSYNPNGRFQTEIESNEIAKSLKAFMQSHNIDFHSYAGDENGYNELVDDILLTLNTEF